MRLIRSTSSRALSSTSRASRREVVAAQADVELRAHRRQRRAQLVRRVGDQPVLLLDAALEPVEHRVERDGQARRSRRRARGTAMRSSSRSMPISLGLGGHPLDRPQRLARQPPAAERGGGERRRAGEQQQRRARGRRSRRRRRSDSATTSTRSPAVPPDRRDERAVALVVGAELDRRAIARSPRERRRARRPPARSAGARPARRRRPARGRPASSTCAAAPPCGSTVRLDVAEVLRRPPSRSPCAICVELAPDLAVDRRPRRSARSCRTRNAPSADDDRREQDRVPGGEPDADRQAHCGSSMKPTPRTVRISRRRERRARASCAGSRRRRRRRWSSPRSRRPRRARAAPSRGTTSPAWRARNSSSANSRARQLDLAARPRHDVRRRVDAQVADLEHRRALGRARGGSAPAAARAARRSRTA